MSRKIRQNVFHSTSVEKSKKVWKVDLLFTTVKQSEQAFPFSRPVRTYRAGGDKYCPNQFFGWQKSTYHFFGEDTNCIKILHCNRFAPVFSLFWKLMFPTIYKNVPTGLRLACNPCSGSIVSLEAENQKKQSKRKREQQQAAHRGKFVQN